MKSKAQEFTEFLCPRPTFEVKATADSFFGFQVGDSGNLWVVVMNPGERDQIRSIDTKTALELAKWIQHTFE